MIITVKEQFDSREATADGYIWRLVAIARKEDPEDDVEDEQAILAACLAEVPTIYELTTPDLETYTLKHEGNGVFRFSINLKPPDVEDPEAPSEGPSFAFSTTKGSTQKLLQSIQTVANYGSSAGPPPDHKRCINVTDKGVEGVEVGVREFSWSESWKLATGSFDPFTLYQLTYTVNNANFRSFAAGEVLFLGATGKKSAGGNVWDLEFNFVASPNATDISMGNNVTVEAKEGWDYVWCRYESDYDTDAMKSIRKPISAHVERVYYRSNFASLGIGTS